MTRLHILLTPFTTALNEIKGSNDFDIGINTRRLLLLIYVRYSGSWNFAIILRAISVITFQI